MRKDTDQATESKESAKKESKEGVHGRPKKSIKTKLIQVHKANKRALRAVKPNAKNFKKLLNIATANIMPSFIIVVTIILVTAAVLNFFSSKVARKYGTSADSSTQLNTSLNSKNTAKELGIEEDSAKALEEAEKRIDSGEEDDAELEQAKDSQEKTDETEDEKEKTVFYVGKISSQLDTSQILPSLGFDSIQNEKFLNAVKGRLSNTDIKRGQKIKVEYETRYGYEEILNTAVRGAVYPPRVKRTKRKILNFFMIKISSEEFLKLQRTENGSFRVERKQVKLTRQLFKIDVVIKGNIFADAFKAGMPGVMTLNAINQLSYDVDFQRDVRKGDRFIAMYEQFIDFEGIKVKNGSLLLAGIRTKRKDVVLYSFEDSKGKRGFYNKKGMSVRKSLLKTPVSGARISSSFGFRVHPILGYTRLHKGMDFSASTGTPVYAAGNGIVEEAHYNGSYGNYVKIKHNASYATAYAHLSAFGRNIRRGTRVEQRQVIGFVGSTGRSTGPHLHFEVIRNGVQINPSAAKIDSVEKLLGTEAATFSSQVKFLEKAFKSSKSNGVINAK